MNLYIVMDEWLIHYIEDEEKCAIAYEILKRIFDVCDEIVIGENTPFLNKFHKMLKKIKDEKSIMVLRFFMQYFYYNLDKGRKLGKNEIHGLEEGDKRAIGHRKDEYLLRLLKTVDYDGIILTTDNKLIDRSDEYLSDCIVSLERFLSEYPESIKPCKRSF